MDHLLVTRDLHFSLNLMQSFNGGIVITTGGSTCGAKLSFAEGKFCWNNEARFGGLQYCREHQAAR
ncbi:hypothetical protein [Ideonella sp. A 288]|uniref:hypothetical protein n=1 Tax=Ideonella sp. A 288 TaxID=1962181 RepID=UPI000B4BD82A|nr:hypothetical protein [Ideonella sp. A 288]